jgi:phosphoenolpyruvate synthase/pyruvate phosphate dikinase
VLPEAPPTEKESELLEQLKGLPLDQAERLMRRMRERELPIDLLDELRDAYEKLRGALERERGKALEVVLKL